MAIFYASDTGVPASVVGSAGLGVSMAGISTTGADTGGGVAFILGAAAFLRGVFLIGTAAFLAAAFFFGTAL